MSNAIKHAEECTLPRVRPATDIFEREDGFHVIMDVPGVSKDALVLDLQDNELYVSGRTAPCAAPQERTDDGEFGAVEYARTISVPDLVDRERISASLVNGVLSLHLPRAEKALPRKIEIRAG